MPKMSVCGCAAAMCGYKMHDSGIYGSSSPTAYESCEYGEVVRMIRSGATDDDIGCAHPKWRSCIMSVRKALSDSR